MDLLMWSKKKIKEYRKKYWLKYRTQKYKDLIAKRKNERLTDEYLEKRKEKKKKYSEKYRRKKGIKKRKQFQNYRDTHITVAEKRECYTTGNYEKALKELMIKKKIKMKNNAQSNKIYLK